MTTKQVIGLILLLAGGVALFYGLSIQNSVQYQLMSAFGHGAVDVVALMVGGGIATIVGLLLLLLGGKSKR